MIKKIVGASVGNCIHVAGIINFLELARTYGYETIFLGPAIPISKLMDAVRFHKPDIVAISYRLTPQTAYNLFIELKGHISKDMKDIKFVFGGTPPVGEVAKQFDIFDAVFTGTESMDDLISYLRHVKLTKENVKYPSTLIARIKSKYPYPLIRHHFGLPSLDNTIKGARELALAKVLDILSIGPDQNAQVSFFRQSEIDKKLDGAGGVPLRKKEDLIAIYNATRCGNFPLVRCYGGTRDLLKWAEMSVETINNAWGAIPLCWYSELDGRSPRPLPTAIKENLDAIRWYGERNIPVEVNESHQWALRECGDTIEIVTAYLSAYVAKKLGVRDLVMQYMFNTPPNITAQMDLAKMLARIELVESLHDSEFTTYRMVRTGLAFLSSDLNIAKGQLASSIQLMMAIKPHIVHVVGYCEGDHAATPSEIIESCKIAEGVIKYSMKGMPNYVDDIVRSRKNTLIEEAKTLISAMKDICDDISKPESIYRFVVSGLLDAPHLKGNKWAKGAIITKIVDGACRPVHPTTGEVITEKERLELLNLPNFAI
jgi:hypothetical protein